MPGCSATRATWESWRQRCALHGKAAAGEMDAAFYGLQAAELVAGAANFSLMAMNFRDGLKLSGRLRRKA